MTGEFASTTEKGKRMFFFLRSGQTGFVTHVASYSFVEGV
jgi:hypothetical protein